MPHALAQPPPFPACLASKQAASCAAQRQQLLAALDARKTAALALTSLLLLEAMPATPADVAAAARHSSAAQWQRTRGSDNPLARTAATLAQHAPRHVAFQLSHPLLHPSEPPRGGPCVCGTDAPQRMLWIANECLGQPYYDGQAPLAVQQGLLAQMLSWQQQFEQRESRLRHDQVERPHQPQLDLPGNQPLPAATPFEQ